VTRRLCADRDSSCPAQALLFQSREFRENRRRPCIVYLMAAENPPTIGDPRIVKAVEYLGTYQHTLRKIIGGMPEEARRRLGGQPNLHLASGPTEVVVCTNGVVAMIQNGLVGEITIAVTTPNVISQTMIDYLNSVGERLFTFTDPISKMSVKGNRAIFQNGDAYDLMFFNLIISDSTNRMWLPPATKVFLIGWKAIESGDVLVKATEGARKSVEDAFAFINLRSGSNAHQLLGEYRALLHSATTEAELQKFLEGHPEFVSPEHDVALPQPSLGGERQPDFGFSMRSAFGARWLFVEIERPNKSIFTRGENFQFSHEFTQAKGQLLQWDSLIARDYSFFEKRFPGLLKPEFHLIYGRDKELDAPRREMLAAEFSSSSNRTFSTFDDLATRLENIVKHVFPNA
jgi:Domain of unknown function (DUF4263)